MNKRELTRSAIVFLLLSISGCGPGETPARPAAASVPAGGSVPAAVNVPTAAAEPSPVTPARLPAGILASLPAAPAPRPDRRGPAQSFVDVAAEAGVQHRHRKGEFDPQLSNIMPWIASIGASAAAADYDGDGDLDLYVSSSRKGTPNCLYRNDTPPGGELRFIEVGREAGVADVNDEQGVTMDVAFGDIDNDRDPDLYIVQWGKNRLFQNDGGKFHEITDAAGAGDRGNGNAGLFFDYDNDGYLDLFVCNYFPNVDLCSLNTTRVLHDSFESARNGGPNVLYRNNRDGTFTDVARALNLDDTGWSLDAGISDLDNDGDVDLYIANDFGQDKLYLNNGDGTFTDATARAIGRETFKGMNADMGDFDGDGFMDIYVANITTEEYLKEGNCLWLNGGDGTFSNVAATTGTADGGWGWCGRFLDYDGDGDLDIFTVNGFVSGASKESYWEALATIAVSPTFDPADAAQWPPMGSLSLSGYETSRLYRNQGNGSFAEVAVKEGIADRYDGRGIVVADFDRDGDSDLFVVNQDQPASLYRNEIGNTHHWLEARLVGTRSNRDAIGARLQLTAGGLRLTREVNGVNGFSSQSELAVHFGLGQAEKVDRLTVFWPSGVVQDFRDLEVDRYLVIEERGEPLPREERLQLYFARPREPSQTVVREVVGAGAALLDLERDVRRKPRNAELANAYRSRARELGLYDREIELFRELIRECGGRPVDPALRLQLALALIDKIPAAKGDILAQGSLAKESLAELAKVLEASRGRSFSANYVAGMNHLYWPESMKHAPDALRHFERCREILRERRARLERRLPGEASFSPAGVDELEEYELPLLIGIADARVKNKEFPAARTELEGASRRFPQSKEVAERLASSNEDLSRLVKETRGLERPIDTSLTVLLHENGLTEAESKLWSSPEDRVVLNGYRLEAAELGRVDRAIAYLERLAARHPESAEPRLALALAQLDRATAAAGEPDAVARAGEARRRLREFRERKPEDWLGPYVAGLIELYDGSRRGPELAGGAPADSVAAAGKASVADLALADRLSARPDGRPRIAAPAVASGDALALAGRSEEAREAWKRVRSTFPALDAARQRLEAGPDALAGLLRASYASGLDLPLDLEKLADVETELDRLEAALKASFQRKDADRYRALARGAGEVDRAVKSLRGLVSLRPASAGARAALALALLDKMPDRELGSVQRGLLSSEALQALDPVLKTQSEAWGVQYLAGVIHLDWFTKQRHLPAALEAFERCLGAGGGIHRPLAYQAIGDALVRDKKFPLARRRWQEGQKEFPDNPGLEERMSQTSLMVEGYVDRLRSWEAPQDTDLLSEVVGDLPDLPAGGGSDSPALSTAGREP